MGEFKITEMEVKAAFDVARSQETKDVLEALFCKSNKPTKRTSTNLDYYTSIKTYEDACEALGEQTIDEDRMFNAGVLSHHVALMKLETISRALWGNKFQPKPDAEGATCYYYPWFSLYTKSDIEMLYEEDKDAILSVDSGASYGFGFMYTGYRSLGASATVGFRLCQETDEKAEYFGKQFVELWSEYIQFNFKTGERLK